MSVKSFSLVNPLLKIELLLLLAAVVVSIFASAEFIEKHFTRKFTIQGLQLADQRLYQDESEA